MNGSGYGIARSLALGVILSGVIFLRAEDAPPPEDTNTSPYHQALLDYKSGKYPEARTAIDQAEKEKPGDLATEILKARILTELHEFAQGEDILRHQLTPTGPREVQIALGDLLLRKRSYERATKYYALALGKPEDPDIVLKIVYAKIGESNLVEAQQYASRLKPFDPKNPYDAHASYYFAKAALAQATGKAQEAEDDIQSARTNYGITVTNRYLKTYLELFDSNSKGGTDLTPVPLLKDSPAK